jgi:hypothetical protein
METHICITCKEEKPFTEDNFRPFCPSEIAAGRKGKLFPKCRSCVTKAHTAWGKKQNLHVNDYSRSLRFKRAELIDSIKDVPCKDCGVKYPPYVMDFDHLPEFEKVDNIPRMINKRVSMDILLAEIAKCEVVCSNCHRIRTMTRGTINGRYAKGSPITDGDVA